MTTSKHSAHMQKYVPVLVSVTMGLVFLVLFGVVVHAAENDFVPLADLPAEFYETKDIGGFFNAVFRYGIVLAGFLAIIMLVVAGFKYMTSDAVGSKSDAKDQIFSAITGLLLILLSAVLLAIINPDILKFTFLNK